MENDVKEFLSELLKQLKSIDYIKPEDIPNIDLYMDQVTTFMDEQLAASKRYESDKILTKTMINNYAKTICSLLRTRKSILRSMCSHCFYILFQNILSINDIRSILNPLTEKYFGNDDGFTMQDVYTEVFSLEAEESQKLLKDLGKKYKIAGETFENFPDEDQKFLHTFSFICMLSFDVYIKKMLIERMIDNLNEEKEASSHENTHSGKESKKTGSN